MPRLSRPVAGAIPRSPATRPPPRPAPGISTPRRAAGWPGSGEWLRRPAWIALAQALSALCLVLLAGKGWGGGDAAVMAEQASLGLAGLLRQLRAEARLTQQELAKAAGVSPRAVSDLERGIHRTARHDTAVRLAGALGLADPARSLFVAAARGRIQAAQVLAAGRSQAPGESPASAGGLHGFVPALTSLVGRAGPVREVAALLDRSRLVTVTGPADEAGQRGHETVHPPGRGQRLTRRLPSPGRQHLRGLDPPAGRRDEQRPGRLGQAQRAGQPHRGVLAGR